MVKDMKNYLKAGRMYLVAVIIVVSFMGCARVPGAVPIDVSLSPQALETVNNAVLEVVVQKPAKDSMQYEKPLPMDLIPYAVRNDKYYSIGTAFAINSTQFVTAAHVMLIGSESQYGEVHLRDKAGKVYRIDKIIKYSLNRDFVVFTLKNGAVKRFLPVNAAPQVNQKVFAVGNALAQGIIIRDGLYTSNTPEEEAGEWQWMRFSAAASPGNSGGPLLDKDGNVIGIVLRKSENENLNYALPISEVTKAPANRAIVHMKLKYVLDNMDMTKMDTFHKVIVLPKTYGQLDNEVIKSLNQFSESLLKKLLAENRQNIFPNGKGSTALLNQDYNAVFPHVIMKDEDGNWDAFAAKDPKDGDLGNNGYLSYGRIGATFYFLIHKPDDIPMNKFIGDSKTLMDLILKGVYVYREVGSEKVKIISMGKAQEDYLYTDAFGRKWTVRTWRSEYNDRKFVIFSLPVPGGCIAMLRVDQTGSVNSGHIPDLKVLTDFIYLSYYGTFKEWREFLALKSLLPSVFSTIDIRIENGKQFRYNSPRLSASLGPELMSITDKSDLKLRFSYYRDRGKTVWDVDGIIIGEDKHTNVSYSIFRNARPPKELPDKFQSGWEDVVGLKFPYNRSAYYKDEYTGIATVYSRNDITKKRNGPSDTVLYTVGYWTSGKVEQKAMDDKLAGFLKDMKVHEGNDEKVKSNGKGDGN
ncbi:MAG: S1 family peptidase [Betaproteobacteria bacterium]